MRLAPGAVAVVVLLLVAGPVAAHGNYVSVDPQVSTDGTVRIELAVVITDGFLVVRTDDGGEFGRPVGHRAFEGNIRSDYPIELDDGYWANLTGSEPLWVVLHRDDGDGEFELDDDPVQTTGSGAEVADRFALRRSEAGPVNVIAQHDLPQETDRNRVSIRTVRLDEPGYLVLRADESGAPGRIVGHRALEAGEHRGVSVTLNRSFYESREEDFRLWAVAHRSDGDDRFEPGEDAAVEVGGASVMSRFGVERTDPIETTASGTTTPATDVETATVTTDSQSPTPTRAVETVQVVTPSPTATVKATDVATTSDGQPGFGPAVAVFAVVAAALLAAHRPGPR